MKISQREARRLHRRVQDLERADDARRNAWAQEWFGGVNIVSSTWVNTDPVPVAIRTARRLGHAVVAIADDGGTVRFMALPLPRVKERP